MGLKGEMINQLWALLLFGCTYLLRAVLLARSLVHIIREQQTYIVLSFSSAQHLKVSPSIKLQCWIAMPYPGRWYTPITPQTRLHCITSSTNESYSSVWTFLCSNITSAQLAGWGHNITWPVVLWYANSPRSRSPVSGTGLGFRADRALRETKGGKIGLSRCYNVEVSSLALLTLHGEPVRQT